MGRIGYKTEAGKIINSFISGMDHKTKVSILLEIINFCKRKINSEPGLPGSNGSKGTNEYLLKVWNKEYSKNKAILSNKAISQELKIKAKEDMELAIKHIKVHENNLKKIKNE